MALPRQACFCFGPSCGRCRSRVANWQKQEWASYKLHGTDSAQIWLACRKGKDGLWGLGCRTCSAVLEKTGQVLSNAKPFAQLEVRSPTACQASHLKRHSQSMFHLNGLKLQNAGTCSDATSPPREDFLRVLDHVVVHGSAPHSGISDIGAGGKIKNMVVCLAEACKRLDQRFLKGARSIALMRDGRKGRTSVRFVAVDASLNVRRGTLGIAFGFGSGADAILKATDQIITDFATLYLGTARERKLQNLRKHIRKKVHMITVDAAKYEVLASELMRQPLGDVLSPLTPNCQIVLRDKAHASRRLRACSSNSSPMAVSMAVSMAAHTFASWLNV